MRTYKLLLISLLTLINLLSAQDSLKILTLSDRTGSEISRVERDKFNLFQEFDDFYSAVIYEKDEKLCDVTITLEKGNAKKDTIITISKRYYLRLQDLVNNFESFKAGKFTFDNLSDNNNFINKFADGNFDGNGVAVVLLKSGSQLEGELISVRKKSVVLLNDNYNFDEDYLDDYINDLIVVENDKIENIVMEGSSYIFPGIFLGTLSGIAIGVLIGSQMTDQTSSDFGDAIGASITLLGTTLLGGIFGGVIGGGMSEADIQFNPESDRDLLYLKELAYYPKTEPEFLKSLN